MVLNYIWIAFFLIALIVALFKTIFKHDYEVFSAMINSTFDMAEVSFEIAIGLTGILCLWLGIMNIGEKEALSNYCQNYLLHFSINFSQISLKIIPLEAL